ncbi:hypothetical protein [Fangia hongkongensis]|uniref:hypothetical protein n=1 Tax=Fangia hongkongensis TaxID=270495 RepID=UPI0003636182|nr:hypothetical protein [Fangia hongkongensis]MBK2125874.1 hypothetical protein [Fangia hongkongensis]
MLDAVILVLSSWKDISQQVDHFAKTQKQVCVALEHHDMSLNPLNRPYIDSMMSKYQFINMDQNDHKYSEYRKQTAKFDYKCESMVIISGDKKWVEHAVKYPIDKMPTIGIVIKQTSPAKHS